MASKSKRGKAKRRKKALADNGVSKNTLMYGSVNVTHSGLEVSLPSTSYLVNRYLYLTGFENASSFSLADIYLNSYIGFVSRLGAYAKTKDGLVLSDRTHLRSYLGKVVKVTGTVFCIRNFDGRLRVLLHTPSIVGVLRGKIDDISFEDMVATPVDFTPIDLDNHIWVDISSSHLVVEEGVYANSNEYGSMGMELVAGSKLTLCATLGLYKGSVNSKDGTDVVNGLKIGFVGDTYLLNQELYILRSVAPSESDGSVDITSEVSELEFGEYNVVGTVDIGFGFNLGRELSLGSIGYNFSVCRGDGAYLCGSNCRFTLYQSSRPSKLTYTIFNEMRNGSDWDRISSLVCRELFSVVMSYSREFSSFYTLLRSRASKYIDLGEVEGYNEWVSSSRIRNRLAGTRISVERC